MDASIVLRSEAENELFSWQRNNEAQGIKGSGAKEFSRTT
jgi:hypothetical protein